MSSSISSITSTSCVCRLCASWRPTHSYSITLHQLRLFHITLHYITAIDTRSLYAAESSITYLCWKKNLASVNGDVIGCDCSLFKCCQRHRKETEQNSPPVVQLSQRAIGLLQPLRGRSVRVQLSSTLIVRQEFLMLLPRSMGIAFDSLSSCFTHKPDESFSCRQRRLRQNYFRAICLSHLMLL